MRRLIAIAVLLALAGTAAFGLHWWRSRGAPAPEDPAPAALDPAAAEEDPNTIAYRCYFPLRAGFGLGEEVRVHPRPETALAGVRTVIAELHQGPSTEALLPLYPKGVRARAVYLVDGTLYVDEPPEVYQQPLGLREEFLFMRAIARTLLRNCPAVTSFVLLSNGSVRHALFSHFPAHGKYLLPVAGAR